jgi:hypothetical protein
MNEAETIATVDVLLDLGFDPTADLFPGFAFDFGNFKLGASRECTNLKFQQVVYFTGVMATPRKLTNVEFELPARVGCREQCIAMIAYYLDSAFRCVFQPARQTDWVDEGRQCKHLLPWMIQQAEQELKDAPYRARPLCFVWREWARLALKTLAQHLCNVNDETPIVFSFRDSVLTIRWKSEVVAMAGSGQDWPTQYAIAAGQLRQFPKRLLRAQVEVSIWDGKLRIGDQLYAGIKDNHP